jgi:signal transduction histidine kinase
LSRPHRGFEECDLDSWVAETLSLMEPQPSFEAMFDPGVIRQALVNLLDNAIRFSPQDSTVEIQLHQDGEIWQIAISDQGPGIPPATGARNSFQCL